MDLPDDIVQEVEEATNKLLPEKSRCRYEKELANFNEWRGKKGISAVLNESVLLAYISSLSKIFKASSLWCKFSMLNKAIHINYDVDVSRYGKVMAFMKSQSINHVPKKSKILSAEECRKFISEASDDYLFSKVVLVFGLYGACRRNELLQLTVDDIEDHEKYALVKLQDTKTHTSRSFIIPDVSGCLNPYAIYKKHAGLRPSGIGTRRFFLGYRQGKCIAQHAGMHTIGGVSKKVATFLGLDHPEDYTGHCLRRSGASMVAESCGNLLPVKQIGGWKSSKVAEGYVEQTIKSKIEVVNMILTSSNSDSNIQSTSKNDAPVATNALSPRNEISISRHEFAPSSEEMDLNEYLKLGLKGYQKKDVSERIRETQELRKVKRNNIMATRRQITNSPSPPLSTQNVQKQNNKKPPRAVLLNLWRHQRDKKKTEEKAKQRPVFKVSKVVDAHLTLLSADSNVNSKLFMFGQKCNPPSCIKSIPTSRLKSNALTQTSLRVTRSQTRENCRVKLDIQFQKLSNSSQTATKTQNKQIDKKTDKTSEIKIKASVLEESKLSSTNKQNENKTILLINPESSKVRSSNKLRVILNKELTTGRKKPLNEADKLKHESEIESKKPIEKGLSLKTPLTVAKNKSRKCPNVQILNENGSPIHPIENNVVGSNHLLSIDNYNVNKSLKNTPETKKDVVIYVSPFVTMSRGKKNARTEFEHRHSLGGLSISSPKTTGAMAGTLYFYNLLDNETARIQAICKDWNMYKNENDLPEESCNMINVAIGQTGLLVSKKMQQFRSLIDSCASQNTNPLVTCGDLHGFWDLISMQIKNLDDRFQNLEKLRAANWEEILPEKRIPKAVPKKKQFIRSTKGSSSIRNVIRERREKLKATIETGEHNEFNGGFFVVKSPQKLLKNTPTSLLKQIANRSTLEKESVNGIFTPSKSILKSRECRSSKKAVLFVENVQGPKERKIGNIENDLNTLNMGSPKKGVRTRSSNVAKV